MENAQSIDKVRKNRNHHRTRPQNTRPTIGLLIERTLDIEEGYLPAISDGVTATAHERDVNLLCFTGGALYGLPHVEFDNQHNILYELITRNNVDGLVILGSIANHVTPEELGDFHTRYHPLPTVNIAPLPGIPSVEADNDKGLRDALVHLIEVHNYRRIAFVRGPENVPEAQMRYRVYTEVLDKYDLALDPDLVAPGNFLIPSGTAAVRLLLDKRQVSFDAVVAANDYMALGALEELQARGILVPYDVAVVGFDNIKLTKIATPSLTTVRQPLFELGRQAVEILLSQIANEKVSEQTTLPTELVVRRSCGCLDPVTTQVATQSVAGAGETTEQVLTTRRNCILADLSQAMDFSTGRSPSFGWEEHLLDSFSSDVNGESKGLFLSTLDKILRLVVKHGGDVASWQEAVSVLRRYTMPSLENNDLPLRPDVLLHQARVLVGEEAEKVLAQQYLRIEQQNAALRAIGQSLITMFDVEKLVDIIVESMPRLGIPGCYLALYEDPQPYKYPQSPPEWSRMVLAYNENERIELESNGWRFRSRRLTPEGMLPQDKRYTMMIKSLHFREEQIGFVLFERGPREGNVYEVLRGQISSALKGALLLRAHRRAEEEVRQHRDHLDELVRERTTELATANERLQQEIEERQQAQEESVRLQQQIIIAQQQAIRELSTPVIPVMERIIILPLVGNIDSTRARDAMRALLAGIREHRAKVVILDITGVRVIDTLVAGALNKTIQAARLKGAHTIITGISDAVAETIVDLGIEWQDVTTLNDLQAGLQAALAWLGQRIE